MLLISLKVLLYLISGQCSHSIPTENTRNSYPFYTHRKYQKTRAHPVSDISFKVNPSLVIFFYFMPPENTRKLEVLREPQ